MIIFFCLVAYWDNINSIVGPDSTTVSGVTDIFAALLTRTWSFILVCPDTIGGAINLGNTVLSSTTVFAALLPDLVSQYPGQMALQCSQVGKVMLVLSIWTPIIVFYCLIALVTMDRSDTVAVVVGLE